MRGRAPAQGPGAGRLHAVQDVMQGPHGDRPNTSAEGGWGGVLNGSRRTKVVAIQSDDQQHVIAHEPSRAEPTFLPTICRLELSPLCPACPTEDEELAAAAQVEPGIGAACRPGTAGWIGSQHIRAIGARVACARGRAFYPPQPGAKQGREWRRRRPGQKKEQHVDAILAGHPKAQCSVALPPSSFLARFCDHDGRAAQPQQQQ